MPSPFPALNPSKVPVPKPSTSRAMSRLAESVLSRMTLPVWIFDIDNSRMVWANPPALDHWRADTLEELRSRDFGAGMSVAVATKLRQYQRDFRARDSTFSEVWTHYPQGVPSTMRVTFSGIALEDGRIAMLCEGVSAFNETPDKMRSAEALVHTTVMISLTDMSDTLLYCNPAARSAELAAGRPMQDRFVDPDEALALKRKLLSDREVQTVVQVRTDRGERWHEIKARLCVDPVSGSPAHLWTEVDVTDLKATEAQARHDACHDALTGLGNRTMVQTEFERRLSSALARGDEVALMFVDLDRFKSINDSLGHGRGDEVLIVVAERLSRLVAPGRIARGGPRDAAPLPRESEGGRAGLPTRPCSGEVARLGGDEFLVMLEGARASEAAGDLVVAVLAAVQEPIALGDSHLRLTASVGISVAPADGTTITALMKHADAAMYEAKKAGKNRSFRYIPEIGRRALTRMVTEMELRRDFEAGRLQVFYQPRVSTRTGRIVGAEALLRWPHAERGFVPPDIFIPLAEDNGTIVPIGAWVLREAAAQQVVWARAGFPITVSVNLSPRQFSDAGLVEAVEAAMAFTGAEPRAIELEITERLLLGEDDGVSSALRRLKAMGFGISIDDFGTGYSNLAELQKHPIDCLKIDRSFIAKLDDQAPILDLIVNMCHLLDVKIVVEGVETEAQLRWLEGRRCDEYQGYLFSRPVPSAAFGLLLGPEPARQLAGPAIRAA